MMMLPGKRQKSCFDRDIDPLYAAWGVDVYDLFVNTKSDLGPNPYVADDSARDEYLNLPPAEQEKLGFEYFLFQKLTELVRGCDRTIHRNKEKLRQELQRKLGQRGGQDFVEDVDESMVDALARNMVSQEFMKEDLANKLKELEDVAEREDANKKQLEPLLEAQKKAAAVGNAANENEKKDAAGDGKGEDDDKKSSSNDIVKKEAEGGDDGEEEAGETKENDGSDEKGGGGGGKSELTDEEKDQMQKLQMELGKLTMQRQKLVFDLSRIVESFLPLQDTIRSMRRNLNYVKSDISTDKTVCEVSGNFMSARDADERIAAHYAGKQYIGWKLVRDKLDEMVKKYGRYGPPPPNRGGPPPPSSLSRQPPPGVGGRGGGGYDRGGDRGGGGRYDRRSSSSGRDRDRGSGGGGSGRWERHGPYGPSGGGGGGGRWRR